MSHNTTCRPKRQDEFEQAKGHRPQTGGVIERVYVFTLREGEFLWIVGLLVAAMMIAAPEEAWSKGNELAL